MVQSRQPLAYRLMESVGLGGPRLTERDCREWHAASQLSGRGPTGVDVAPVPARLSNIQ